MSDNSRRDHGTFTGKNLPVRSFERQDSSSLDKASQERVMDAKERGSRVFTFREVEKKNSLVEGQSPNLQSPKASPRAFGRNVTEGSAKRSQGLRTFGKVMTEGNRRGAFTATPSKLDLASVAEEKEEVDPILQEAMDHFRQALLDKGRGNFSVGWRKYFDENGDSKISFSGFYRGLANMGYTRDAMVLWKALGHQDEEGSVTVSLHEIDPWSASVLRVFKDWVIAQGGPGKVFDIIDVDENHALTVDEFKQKIADVGIDWPQLPSRSLVFKDPVEDIFAALDKNGQGVVTEDEFLFLESDAVKRRSLTKRLEQRRFEKLGGVDGRKHRPWRAPHFLKTLTRQTNPIFGGKYYYQLTDDDMALTEKTTDLLHRSSIVTNENSFSSKLKNLIAPAVNGCGGIPEEGEQDNQKPQWMRRALSELERADLASREGHRVDVRDEIRDNLRKIQDSEERLKALAHNMENDTSSQVSWMSQNQVSFANSPTCTISPKKPRQIRLSPQPLLTPPFRSRKYSSGTQCSTRCSTAESEVTEEGKARKRRAAYTAPPTPEIQVRRWGPQVKHLTPEKDISFTRWGHAYRPATSPEGTAHSAGLGHSASAPHIGLKAIRPASQPHGHSTLGVLGVWT